MNADKPTVRYNDVLCRFTLHEQAVIMGLRTE